MAIFCYLHISKWLAFSSLHKPLFSEHSSVYFANSQWPAAGHNRAHCNVQLNLEELFQTQCIFFFLVKTSFHSRLKKHVPERVVLPFF